ncbi:unnamed protein product [Knipowitschia caucasica]
MPFFFYTSYPGSIPDANNMNEVVKMKKNRHVVAWYNKAEFDHVREHLFSGDPSLQKHSLGRISAWKCRLSSNTPVAIGLTADLVRCQVMDRRGQLDGHELVMVYGTAIVRFVNLITERQQGRVARSLRHLAGKLNIPEWIVNMRHDFTHNKPPSLKWCRKGCKTALEWLQQEYWNRQLNTAAWDSDGEEDDGCKDNMRQRDMEAYGKARELLISYEKEQYQHQASEGGYNSEQNWPSPFADMSWLLAEIKQCASDSFHVLLDALLEEGFMVPTSEQLETLGCENPSTSDVPKIPQVFLRFWLPLLKTLNSPAYIHLLLEKLFAELKLLTSEPNHNRAYFISAWISEVILCNCKRSDFHFETKNQRKARLKDRIFANRIQLRWQQLLSACMDAPFTSTPHLLKLIFDDMDHPLPVETQHNLIRLSSIYTQQPESALLRKDATIYTVDSLHEMQRKQRRERAEKSSVHREMSEGDADKVCALRGSPWQLCTDNIIWKNFPLGKVPGQTDDPSYLMIDTYSLMKASDQPVEVESHSSLKTTLALKFDGGPDVGKLKSGIKLF